MATNSSLTCQDVVRALIKKYEWGLLSEADLVAMVLNAAGPDASPAELERLARQCYAAVLCAACRQNDDPARRQRAYYEVWRFLLRVAYQRWPDLAEPATQRALLLLYEQIDRCQNPSSFLMFAFFKLRQAVKTELRAENCIPLTEEIINHEYLAETLFAFPVRLWRAEKIRALVEAIMRLPDRRQQRVIVLKYFGGLSDETIAARLGLTPANVRVLRHRGLAQLRQDERLRAYFDIKEKDF